MTVEIAVDANKTTGEQIKSDFPIFSKMINGKPLIYLDSAATTQKPQQVLDAIISYYTTTNANVHRGLYTISEQATKLYDDARTSIATFIEADFKEIIFTRNATESMNLLAHTIPTLFSKKKTEIVITEMEHHSNLVPWQELAKRNNLTLKFIPMKDDFTINYDEAEKIITDKTALVAMTHVSNALGTIIDIQRLIAIAKKHSAFTVVDASQSVPHMPVSVKEIDCDFLAFSGHKILGPMGIGVLYGKQTLLEQVPPFLTGGDMISDVSKKTASWNDLPMKFEAGTPNVAGAIGLASAIDYITTIGFTTIQEIEHDLLEYTLKQLEEIDGIRVFNAGVEKSVGVVSFTISGIHAHDLSTILNDSNVCIRAGHHCAMPLMELLGVDGTSRVSFYLYNTKNDVDVFIKALTSAISLLK